ncbi:hypothetical protein ASE82_17650 [Sphingomonas sp. Leaf230]|nr:hypothetical protein ASE82_17650 [Sphingomonas sp. Leaf230]
MLVIQLAFHALLIGEYAIQRCCTGHVIEGDIGLTPSAQSSQQPIGGLLAIERCLARDRL